MKGNSLVLIICMFILTDLVAQKTKNWQKDPAWQKVKYGNWGGPGVNPVKGPMDTILLKDYAPASSVVSQETFIPKARYPAIDVHAHVNASNPAEVAEWVKTMNEVGIEMTVVLTGATGKEFDRLVDMYLKPFPGRFQLYCGLDRSNIASPDYSQRAVAELERCYNMGARGVGELIDKGSGFTGGRLAREKRLHPDDARLDAFWNKCAELKMPVSLHIADHPSCWKPLDVYQERSPDYQQFNQYGKDVSSYDELMAIFGHTLERHPKTIFFACHLANLGNDLGRLSLMLEKYPNLYLDISARDYEVGRTPRAAGKFLAKYQNRILFGTDMEREKSMYQSWWRLFESDDEYIVGRVGWRYYGLGLPPTVLESLYRGNATKLMNWDKR